MVGNICRVSTQYRRTGFYLGGVTLCIFNQICIDPRKIFILFSENSYSLSIRFSTNFGFFLLWTFFLRFRSSVTKLLSILQLMPSSKSSVDPILVIVLFCSCVFDISGFKRISTSRLLYSLLIKLELHLSWWTRVQFFSYILKFWKRGFLFKSNPGGTMPSWRLLI